MGKATDQEEQRGTVHKLEQPCRTQMPHLMATAYQNLQLGELANSLKTFQRLWKNRENKFSIIVNQRNILNSR